MFYKVVIGLAHLIIKICFKVRFIGLENIPKGQGYVLCSNHRTYFDPIFDVVKIPNAVHFMAKEELFRNKFFGWFIGKVNAFPIARGSGDGKTFEHAQEVLDNGETLLVFIEGTRSKTGILGRPRSGAAMLAGRTGVGVLPVSIDYGKGLSFRTLVTIRFQPLLTKEDLGIDLEKPKTIRLASKKIMESIASGLTYNPQKEDH